MKCQICDQDFNPENLEEVTEHQHAGIPTDGLAGITGVFVGRTFTAEQSGNVDEIRLNRADKSIDVTYRNRKTYRYLDVPVDVMETAKDAVSIGSWINRTLKGIYRYTQITTRPTVQRVGSEDDGEV